MTAFGDPHRHFRATDSTNARARELALAGAGTGLVVSADEQSAGRGRQGRSWFGPAGAALLYSALLRPLGDRPLLPLAVPLAVCEAAEAIAPVSCAVKWPNDVWVDQRKLAGILIESRAGRDGFAVIGVGLNVAVPAEAFPAELAGTATSLGAGDGDGPTVSTALAALNEALGRWVDAPADRVLAEFRARDALRGRAVAWEQGEGVASGIDDSGHLMVDASSGETVALGAGEVHLAPPGSPGVTGP
jgi:BirA family transcriptional regulator, biotin operon repressor / biotin---[acetyl-CoA-carboxylase] ligase